MICVFFLIVIVFVGSDLGWYLLLLFLMIDCILFIFICNVDCLLFLIVCILMRFVIEKSDSFLIFLCFIGCWFMGVLLGC